MSESGMRKTVIKTLKKLDAFAVENPIFPGTPDVNYIDGWIELKWLRAFPANPNTPVCINHYSQQQRLWIRRRHLAGGKVFLLLQCRREWFLFKHPVTMQVGDLTYEELKQLAFKYWQNGINKEELVKWLS